MVHLSVELGSAFISVGLGTNKLGPEIKKVFADVDSTAGAAGASAGKSFSGKFSGFMKSAALPAAGVVGGIGLMAKNFGDIAAVAEQNMGAVETVFGKAAAGVGNFAANSANAVGLSSSSYNELSAVTGSALKSAGVSVDDLAAKNDELITRGADLASVFGGDTASAVGAMGAAFRGEFDTLEQYGVNLTAEAINAELAARGQDKLGGAALEAAKKQATMDLIMEKSAGSAGNFAKESDTAAGAQQRSTAAWEDASAKLGEVLLPIMTTAATKLSELSTWVSQNSGLVTGFAIGIGILAGAILLVNGGLAAYAAVMAVVHGATVLWTGVQWLLNTAFFANPITWIILGIVALIAAIVLLVMNWDTVVKFLTDVWGGFIGWITGVINGFVGFWNDMWGNVGKFISDVWNNIVNWVTGALGNVWRTIMSVVNAIKAYWDFAWTWLMLKIREVWEGITKGVSDGINGVVEFVGGLKDRILGFFANAGTLLLDAGGQIIGGFLKGLEDGFNGVKDFVGGIGQWIADHKGPKAYDLALLVPAGGWIMDGLEDGIESSLPSLQRTLGGVSATIAAGLTSPNASASYTPVSVAGVGSNGFPSQLTLRVGDHEFTAYLTEQVGGQMNQVASIAGGRSR